MFGVDLNESLIHSAVKNYLANRRQGTSATKTRGNVSGSAAESFGSRREPDVRESHLCVRLCGRAAARFTDLSRAIGHSLMPKKMRRGALRSALSERLREGNIIVIDEFVD